jgi:toxin ParE1/3/4
MSYRDSAITYVTTNISQVGQNFDTAIVEHIESLFTHPDIDRVVPEFNDELIPALISSLFRVVYPRESNLINIIRV